ncbi:MAG: FecR domain-containing protein [Pseudomonadota bacterium]
MTDPNHQHLLEEAADIYLRLLNEPDDPGVHMERDAFLGRGDAERRAWAEILDAWQATGARRKSPARAVQAAVVLAAIGLGFAFWPNLRVHLLADHLAGQSPLTVSLVTGDVAELDAGSALIDRSDGDARDVVLLEGSGYFDVVPGERRFRVTLGPLSVEALGTAFETLHLTDGYEVTVTEGLVAVSDGDTSWELAAGDRLVWTDDQAQQSDGHAIDDIAAWRDNRLVADGMRFGDVADALDRRLPGTVLLTNGALADALVTGTFDLNRPLPSLRVLAASYGARVVAAPPAITVLIGGE